MGTIRERTSWKLEAKILQRRINELEQELSTTKSSSQSAKENSVEQAHELVVDNDVDKSENDVDKLAKEEVEESKKPNSTLDNHKEKEEEKMENKEENLNVDVDDDKEYQYKCPNCNAYFDELEEGCCPNCETELSEENKEEEEE